MTTRLSLINDWNDRYGVIPKGWRRVRSNERIKAGDRYMIGSGPTAKETEWGKVGKEDSRIGMECDPTCFSMHITPV